MLRKHDWRWQRTQSGSRLWFSVQLETRTRWESNEEKLQKWTFEQKTAKQWLLLRRLIESKVETKREAPLEDDADADADADDDNADDDDNDDDDDTERYISYLSRSGCFQINSSLS